jgi:hypothetical protein
MPKLRDGVRPKQAVIVASGAAPSFLIRFTTGMVSLLKRAASMLGAKTVAVLFIGGAARDPRSNLSARIRQKARILGKKLATSPA